MECACSGDIPERTNVTGYKTNRVSKGDGRSPSANEQES